MINMIEKIDVGKLMRENAIVNGVKLRVSPDAVNEYASRLIDKIEDNMLFISELTLKDKRKTIRDKDIVRFFSVVGRDVI